MSAAIESWDAAWVRFVIEHGYGADTRDLCYILGQTEEAIRRLRASGACTKSLNQKSYGELFSLWHDRKPEEADWPAPRLVRKGQYEWQARELAFLATLVGTIGAGEITDTLTNRLKQMTGDPEARRSANSVQNMITRIGLQSGDVVGGITVTVAAKEVGSLAMVHQAIEKGSLKAMKVGRIWVIPHEAWSTWKTGRTFPPAGYVQLSTLKQPLSILSDKLSEFARMGYIPTAIRCNPYGSGKHSTQFGSWYVAPETAKRLLDDRQAGRPMPWHGKANPDNLKVTYRLWLERKHHGCKTCDAIWGPEGAPEDFDSYTQRYPPLAHGAKRHLTLAWSPGLTAAELASKAGCATSRVKRAVDNGLLEGTIWNDVLYVTKTNGTLWIERKCPVGDHTLRSWLSIPSAIKEYLFTKTEIESFIADGRLRTKTGTDGAMRGTVYVLRHQCAKLRSTIGFTEEEAANRAGVSVTKIREILKGANWRGTDAIPLSTIQTVIRRLQSAPGHTVEEAAAALGQDVSWVQARVEDGTVRLWRPKWDTARPYLSAPMLQRLRLAIGRSTPGEKLDETWLLLAEAAMEAGVSITTLIRWAEQGQVTRARDTAGWRYSRDSVRKQARTYWETCRFHRAKAPGWLRAEATGPD